MKVGDILSAHDLFSGIWDKFLEFLNCGLFTTDSLEGWLCIFILGYFLWKLAQKAADFVHWSVGMILLLQIGYFLSQTSLNDLIPLDFVFRYDVLGDINRLITNQTIHDALAWLNEKIQFSFVTGWDMIASGEIVHVVKKALFLEAW